jgi:hypothetical protein
MLAIQQTRPTHKGISIDILPGENHHLLLGVSEIFLLKKRVKIRVGFVREWRKIY